MIEKGIDFTPDVYDKLRPIEEVEPLNPASQIPILEIDGRRLFDSGVILRYLVEQFPHDPQGSEPIVPSITRPDMRWDDELILATTEALTNAIVSQRLYQVPDEDMLPFLARQRYRIGSCLDWLEKEATPEGFWPGTFSVMDISLLCPVAFGEKRGVFRMDEQQWPTLAALLSHHGWRASVGATPINEMPA